LGQKLPTWAEKEIKQMAEKLLYRVSEAAEALSLSRSKVYEMINEGKIPACRMGGVLRIPVAGLLALVEEQAGLSHEAQL